MQNSVKYKSFIVDLDWKENVIAVMAIVVPQMGAIASLVANQIWNLEIYLKKAIY